MPVTVGVRREDKNDWERRTPIIPDHARALAAGGIRVAVQPSPNRVFSDSDYSTVGASVSQDLSEASVIFGIKEIPATAFIKGKAYAFFSHTIKGQKYNMAMLKSMMDLECTLIDYERVVDETNRRLIFFGKYAGMAGMVDTLVAFSRRLEHDGLQTPFSALKRPLEYGSISEIKIALEVIGRWIRTDGLPASLAPMVVGFAGYGNVSQGAQEMFDLLPVKEVSPEELGEINKRTPGARHTLFKVVFKEEDMVKPRARGGKFDLQDYYKHPEKYRGVFQRYLSKLTMLVNCVYWDARYPRLVTKEYLAKKWKGSKLIAIGDISCDINGAVEATEKATDPGNPYFVYEPASGRVVDGVVGDGPVIMAVDILPSELPRDASTYFSGVLLDFVPAMAKADYSADFERLDLPPPIKRAVILHKGKLTPDYMYMEEYVR